MICKECGAYNPDHASFCKVCAASLKDAPAYEEPQAESYDEPADQDPQQYAEEQESVRPARSFAKPPVWKPTSNVTFERRRYTPSIDMDHPADDGQDDDDVQAYVRSSQQPRFRPEASDAAEQDDDTRDAEASRAAFASASPTRRFRAPEPDPEEDDEDEPVRPAPVKSSKKAPVRPPVDDEDDDDEEDEDDEPIRRAPVKSAKKKPVARDYDDEDDEDDDEDEEPVRRAPVKSAKKKPVARDYDDEDDEDDDESYAPRQKKQKSATSGIFTTLLVVLLVLILAVVVIVVLANNVPSIGEKLSILKIDSCSGAQDVIAGGSQDTPAVDPNAAGNAVVSTTDPYIEESVNESGIECVKFCVYVDVGETLTIDLPNQDDYSQTNTSQTAIDYKIEIPKQVFYPNAPLDSAEYVVTPNVTLTDASGTARQLNMPTFTLTFPAISLSVTNPSYTGEPIMAADGNVVTIEGKVDTHTVSVYANDQKLSVYEDGYFKGDYVMQSDAEETIVIRAEQDNYVKTSTEIKVTPYVFVPIEMSLSISKGVSTLRAAEKTGELSVKGVAEPGATLVAASDNENVVCGSVAVGMDGNYTFNVTFASGYYGIATVTVSAVKEGYTDTSATCIVTRMYDDKDGFTKNKNYYEVPRHKTMDEIMTDPSQAGYYRMTIKLLEVTEVDGYKICKVEIKQSGKDPVTAYMMNQSEKWDPNESRIGNEYNVYCMLNGLYPDTEYLYAIVFFAVAR